MLGRRPWCERLRVWRDHGHHAPAGPAERVVIGCSRAGVRMEALLVSTAVVALAEMGDKTQLLSLVLAARFRRPVPIILGILVATLANHAAAGALGAWVQAAVGPEMMRWPLGLSFIAMALWMLIPDKLDEDSTRTARLGAFGTTLIAFFLAEIGDKTQIATVALAAQYTAFWAVVAGTTMGMMIANVPAVLFGDRLMRAVPIRLVHGTASAIFAVLGFMAIFNVGDLL